MADRRASDSEVIPLFPLDHVLMPGCALPLRIFEPRYREMLADVRVEGGADSFGVVALLSGIEVDTRVHSAVPHLAEVGTLAQILEVETLPDATISVLTGGTTRFRIERLLDDSAKPYLTAEVSWLKDVDGQVPPNLPGAAKALAAEYSRLLHLLTGSDHDAELEELPKDPTLLSFRLATDAPITQEDKQQLLEDDTAVARLLHVQRVLRREVILLRRTRSVALSPRMLQAVLRMD